MINFLCLLCSLCIQFASAGITIVPYDYSLYTPVTTNLDYISNNIGIDLSSVYFIDIEGNSHLVFVPLDYFTDASDPFVISFSQYIVNDDSEVIGFSMTLNNCRSYYYSSSGRVRYNDYTTSTVSYTCYFSDSVPVNASNYYIVESINTDYLPFILNQVPFVVNGSGSDDVIGSLGIGSMSVSGHSGTGNPLEALQGFTFTAHSSSYIQSGHNTHVNPSNATPDFTDATQNLLGQIVDNTNSLIENSNNLGGALETINSNIINGVSALFNGVSQLNNNFVSSVIIDKEELNDQWTSSNTYLAFVSMQNSFNLLQSTADDLIDRYSATEDVDELIIPIDLTVWQISSSDYGNFKPFNEVYYMRFGFLDESKALWQPLFIALLYFCLFFGIVLDLPNIIRGAK